MSSFRKLACSAFLCAVAGFSTLAMHAQEQPQAYVGAQVLTVSGPAIPDGVLVVQRGKIIAVGDSKSVQIPAGAERIDVKGKVIMPGIVDSHSHIGGGSGGDGSAPMQPDARILDSLNARDNSIKRARTGGVTTVNVMPGSGHLLSGQTLYLKLRKGDTIDDLLNYDEKGNILGGIKMANGTNSLRPASSGPFPGTRAKSAAIAREMFLKALDYREKLKRAGDDDSKKPARDLALESLLDAIEGRKVVHFHSHRHDDILTALRLSKEFGFKIVLHHVSEGWKVPQQIAAQAKGASVIMIDAPGGKLETMDVSWTTPNAIMKAGGLVGFHTDDYITDSRLFLRSAGLAIRAGMSREDALKAMTINNAKILDLDKRIGTLEPGKDADFIVLSGDPFSVYTHVIQSFIEGKKVFDRNDPADRLYAVGGYGAGKDQDVHIACFEDETGREGGRE